MKKTLPLLLLLLFHLATASGQESAAPVTKKNQLYVRTMINQINLGYDRAVSSRVSLSLEGGYQVNYLNGWTYTGNFMHFYLLYRNLAYYGWSIRFSPKIRIGKNWAVGPLAGYQDLTCNNVTYDPGHFAGEDDTYQEYQQTIKEMIVQAIFYRRLNQTVQFYLGLGARFQHIFDTYKIEGNTRHTYPSNRKDDYNTIYFPQIIVGFEFSFARF
jgi:hypothetical protein